MHPRAPARRVTRYPPPMIGSTHARRRRLARAACGLAAAALGLAAREARACKCSYDGARMSAPNLDTEAIALREESIALTCDQAPRGLLACTWRARYRLHNDGEAQAVEFRVTHPQGARVELALDGAVAASVPTSTTSAQRAAAARESTAETRGSWAAPADGEVVLTVAADFLVAPWGCSCAVDTNKRRHPWVTRWPNKRYFVNHEPGGPFASAPAQLSVVHEVRRGWVGDPNFTYRRAGRGKVATGQQARATSDLWDERARFDVERPLRFEAGGPIVGVGVGWSPEGVRPRLRVGWELAWPNVLVHTLAFETDARRRALVIPAWELTIPGFPIYFPDLGAGIGAPIQVAPTPRAGVRVLGRFGFWIFHLVGAFDHFPATRGLPRERLGSLLLQVGF